MHFRSFLFALSCLASCGYGQTVYFHQDFSKTASLVNPQPDTGQFSHIILTAPALSYHKFHKGYMELVRTRQDSATGGIIRAMRATPFSPNPETLVIRITFSVESVAEAAQNAVYLYVGEDFNPVNNSFPGNALMFAKCALSFNAGSFAIKDLEPAVTSRAYPLKTTATLTWVLNNSDIPLPYNVSGTPRTALPGTYDLWLNDEPVHLGSQAYPGNSAYSAAKLSNFEMRFRNGVGNIRVDEVFIYDGKAKEPVASVFAFPNPANGREITLAASGVDSGSVRLTDMQGRQWPLTVKDTASGRLKMELFPALAAGLYLLQFQDQRGGHRSVKVLVN